MESTTNGVGLASSSYARGAKHLIKVIDDIRALGGESFLDLPRIAVIGNQSAGKSSLIEAISGITLPRSQGTCTRCPMECRLHQKPNSKWTCRVALRFETDRSGNPIHIQKPFGDDLFSTQDLEDRLRRAQRAILNPDVDPKFFLSGDSEVAFSQEKQLAFSSNVVCIDVWGPDVPDLSFIDLPGIIQNETEPGSMEAIKTMVKKHVQGSCIILLTITMRDDIENQNAAQVAKEADPTGVRTLGVLTKADLIQEGEEAEWRDILEGRKHTLALGYFITKQPGPKDSLTHAEARQAERDFFANDQTWSACSTSTRARMGTEHLGARLSSLLSSLIDRELPKIRNDVRNLEVEVKKELDSLPDEITEPPNLAMLKLVNRVSTRLALLVQGNAHHKQMIQACNPAFQTFQRDIRGTAPNFVAKTRSEAVASWSSRPVPGLPALKAAKPTPTYDKSPFHPATYDEDCVEIVEAPRLSDLESSDSDTGKDPQLFGASKSRKRKFKSPKDRSSAIFLNDLSNLVAEHVTRELPYNVPYGAKVRLIARCFERWEEFTFKCADAIIGICKIESLKAIEDIFGPFTFSNLDRASRTVVENEIDSLTSKLKERLVWLIGMEQTPYTQNLHYLSDYRTKFLTRYRAQRPKRGGTDNNLLEQALNAARAAGFKLDSVADLSRLAEPDEYEQELEIAAEVRAYFQVAYKRVIDMVPRIIDQDFIRELRPRIQDALQMKLLRDDQVAARYLAEDPDVIARRKVLVTNSQRLGEINLKLESLNSGNA